MGMDSVQAVEACNIVDRLLSFFFDCTFPLYVVGFSFYQSVVPNDYMPGEL